MTPPGLDTTRFLDTPEGAPLSVSPAGPAVRIYAWLIDLLIRILAYTALGFGLSLLGKVGIGIMLLLLFLGEWFYPVLFEVLAHGATPGKKIMRLRVIRDNGAPVDWHASMIRNLLRTIDMLPFTYGFGLLSMLLSQDFKRLGDHVAGTLVIYNHPPVTQAAIPLAPAQPARMALSMVEQQAIIDYAARADGLTSTRRTELAQLATPLSSDGKPTPQTLLQIANWIIGRERS